MNEENSRQVFLSSQPITFSPYSKNTILTTPSTWLTLIPKTLFLQFFCIPQFFLLLQVIIQQFPSYSDYALYSTGISLIFLLSFNLAKDGLRIYFGKKLDSIINSAEIFVWSGSLYKSTQSQALLVGQVVKVFDLEKSLADILVLYSSNSDGTFYADYDGLVGSVDIKIQKAVYETQSLLANDQTCIENLNGKICFQEPNNDYLSFKGKLHLDKNPKVIDLSHKNMLYRNSKLIRTGYVVGVVIYAGVETKSCFNMKKRKNKRNVIQKKMSVFYIILIFLYAAFVIFSVFMTARSGDPWSELKVFKYYMSRYSLIIPSYVLIFLDISRFIQVLLIKHELKKRCSFSTTNINENLGALEYIVTSTSGTLTESLIQVKACMIGGTLYTENPEIDSKPSSAGDDTSINLHSSLLSFSDLQKRFSNQQIQEFFLIMSLCNSITMSKIQNSELFTLSREELAMIAICKEFNVQLTNKTSSAINIQLLKQSFEFKVVASGKGRNSRILIEKDEKLTLLVRGTIDHMLHLILFEDSTRESLLEKFSSISSKGYQIFIVAKRTFKDLEVSSTLKKINNAKSFPSQASSKIEKFFRKNERKLTYVGMFALEDQVLSETQESVSMLRHAGIKIWAACGESKFSAVATCRRSGLIDPETPLVYLSHVRNYAACVKILASCISRYVFQESDYENSEVMTILKYKGSKIGDVFSSGGSNDAISFSADTYGKMYEEAEISHKMSLVEERLLEIIERSYSADLIKFSLVVDRDFFKIALSHPHTQKMLTCLLFAADSVCFVKLMSQDKADVVELIQKNFKYRPYVLALGDKETDIPMMQQADVGVCVRSSESKEPQSYADLIIEHFSLIRELVLIYGNLNLKRISRLVLLNCFSNMLFNVFMVFQLFLSDFWVFEGFDVYYFLFFNLLITFLPQIYLGVEKGHLNRFKLFKASRAYSASLQNDDLSLKSFSLYVLCAFLDACLIFIISNRCLTSVLNSQGRTEDHKIGSTFIFIILVLTSLLQTIEKTSTISSLFLNFYLFSLFLMILLLISDFSLSSSFQGFSLEIMQVPLLLLNILTLPCLCVLTNSCIFFTFQRFFKSRTVSRLEQFENKLSSVYKARELTKQSKKDIYDLNPIKVKFYSPHIETAYQECFINSNIKNLRLLVIIYVILFLLWTIIEPLLDNLSKFYIIIRSIIAVILIVFTILTWSGFFKANFQNIFIFLFAFGLLYKLIVEIFFIEVSVLLTVMIPSITFVFLNFEWLKISFLNLANFILFTFEVFYLYKGNLGTFERLISVLTLFSIFITLCFLARTLERTHRMQFKLIRLQEITYEKTQRILGFLLPSFVKKKVKDGARYIAEDQGTVTVLFCDISDFDTIIADYSTSELITFLDSFYQRLDILCGIHGVSKIETVGKTYMACSGLKDSELEMEASITSLHHSKRALNLAFAIIEETKKITLINGSRLEVKIGVHSGQVTAGVVGYHKPQFSLVGDTVNTASRMCSTLEIGNAIQISLETYENAPEFLSNKFSPSRIYAKGKGMLETFVYSANGPWECWNFLDELTSYKTTSALSSALHTEKTESRSATKEKGILAFLDETFRMDTVYLQSSKCCFCSFNETDKEQRFRMDKLESNKDFMRFGLIVCFCYYLVTLSLELSLHVQTLKNNFPSFLLRGFSVFLYFVLILAFKKYYKRRAYGGIIYVIILLVLADLLLMQLNLKHDFLMTTTSFFYEIVILNHLTGYSYILICWLEVPLILFWLVFALLFERSELLITTTLFLILFSFVNTLAVYIRENQLRSYFNLKALTEKDMIKTEKLLIQMIPPHVLENMKNNKTFTDKLYDVTLLYADIVGFTSWSSNKTPKEVVDMLSNLFTRFDKLCVIHKVYKVHTIGDCYVVMGYLEGKERDPHNECNSVINMALSMISVIDRVNREQGIDLKMRIGVHTGNIIAGIIGTNIVRYDIYGPDVLIANKMESCGEAGKISISDVTKRFLQENCLGDYSFVLNKEIVLKTIDRKHLSYFLSVN